MKKKKITDFPTAEQIEKELARERYKHRYGATFRSTVYILVTVAAIAVLVATLWMPVLQIYGNSMSPTLTEGDIVLSVISPQFDAGDVISFYYNNKLLVKRVIGLPGDVINMDELGNISVNGKVIDEPYVSEKSPGECNIIFPFTVPDEKYFVLGDHREVSLDSRSSVIGCITKDQIVGKLTYTVWPYKSFKDLSEYSDYPGYMREDKTESKTDS